MAPTTTTALVSAIDLGADLGIHRKLGCCFCRIGCPGPFVKAFEPLRSASAARV